MKFFFSTLALLAGTNALVVSPAVVVVERDLSTATNVITDVSRAFGNLAQVAKAYDGDIAPLHEAAATLIAKLDSGTAALNHMTPLTLNDCFSLIGPSSDLATQSDDLSKLMQSRVKDVQAVKRCASVRAFIDKGVAGASALITALANKVPSALQSTVQTQGDKATIPLRDARAAYAADKCKDD